MALFPLGLGLFVMGFADISIGRQSLAWPTAAGVILSSEPRSMWLGPDQPRIRYRYDTEAGPRVSTEIWATRFIDVIPVVAPAAASEILRRFPAGAKVAVHVDPRDPHRSALLPGPGRAIRWTIVCAMFLLAGIFTPFAVHRRMRRAER